jgi:hypothetical protein
VLVVSLSVLGIGLGGFSMALNTIRGDASMNIVHWQFKMARETAINQRRSVEMRFTPPNFMSVVRRNIPSGEPPIRRRCWNTRRSSTCSRRCPIRQTSFGRTTSIDFGSSTTAVMFNAEGQLVTRPAPSSTAPSLLVNPARR